MIKKFKDGKCEIKMNADFSNPEKPRIKMVAKGDCKDMQKNINALRS